MFGITWRIHGLPEDDPRRIYVEFTLEPVGATRLTVVGSGFGQLSEDAYRARPTTATSRAGPGS